MRVTSGQVNVINAAGAYPTRNFSKGQFEGTEAISGERQHDVIVERGGEIAHACHRGCTIKCSGTFVDKDGNFVTKQPEYETVWAHGANCGIDDLDVIAELRPPRQDFDLRVKFSAYTPPLAAVVDTRIHRRSREAHGDSPAALFAIVQGGLDPDLRARCAAISSGS